MSTAKPAFQGTDDRMPANWPKPLPEIKKTCRDALKAELKAAGTGRAKTNELIAQLVAEARNRQADVHYARQELGKEQLLVELKNILESAEKLADKLTKMSDELAILLPIEADPKEARDLIEALLLHLKAAYTRIEELPRKPKPNERLRSIAEELAINCLHLLQQYGITCTAYADDNGNASPAIKILKIIGDEIGLVNELATWKVLIRNEVKKHL